MGNGSIVPAACRFLLSGPQTELAIPCLHSWQDKQRRVPLSDTQEVVLQAISRTEHQGSADRESPLRHFTSDPDRDSDFRVRNELWGLGCPVNLILDPKVLPTVVIGSS